MRNLGSERFERELQHEEEMFNRGVSRFNRQIQTYQDHHMEGATTYGKRLLKIGIEPVALGVKEFVDKAYSGKAGRRHIAATLLKGLDPYVVAYLSLRKLIDCVSYEDSFYYQMLASNIGREIELEVKLGVLYSQDRDRYNMTFAKTRTSNLKNHRRAVFSYAFGKSETVEFERWNKEDLLHLGSKLIDIIVEKTGFFTIASVPQREVKNKKVAVTNRIVVHPTSKCLEFIETNKERASMLNPDYLPTLIPPKKWRHARGGGYYNRKLPKLNLIKTYNQDYLNILEDKIQKGELNEVLSAVNALQETAWAINPKVLEVLEHYWWTLRGGVADLPHHDDEKIPCCPVCGEDINDLVDARQLHPCLTELKEIDKERFLEWRKQAGIVRKRNATNFGRRLGVSRILTIAKMFLEEEEFYFPYQLDFRGRIYAVPPYLNPQGTQVAKGLLQFAHGKRLGSMEAVKWLAIHGANTYGNDKVSFDDRYSFIIQNQAQIVACAEDPYHNLFWTEADEPFPFLAFCFEWKGYCEQGLDFVSRLPIAMDGSCNGLQLFSLMLRDEDGGRAVNLIPSEKPEDIYRIVAEKALMKVEQDAKGEPYEVYKDDGEFFYERKTVANLLLRMGINRKTTKRQVMVLPYGGTFNSCIEYTKEWIVETVNDKGFPWTQGVSMQGAAVYLAHYIWEAIEDTIVSAKNAMKFLRDIASVLSKNDAPVRWTTPCNLPVLQEYKETSAHRIKTKIGESFTYFTLTEEIDKYSVSKQRSGMSPNYVHSLDASALMKTVNRSQENDIQGFAMIHDSYGTHAADTPKLAKILREVFVDMFSANLLERLLLEVQASLPITEHKKLPVLPPVGTLDINRVLKSDFFFA